MTITNCLTSIIILLLDISNQPNYLYEQLSQIAGGIMTNIYDDDKAINLW